jgi:hypothetical protein
VRRFSGWLLRVTLDFMPDRTGNLIVLSRTQVATAATALSMLVIAAGAGWPQAAAPPSSSRSSPGIQTSTQQTAPDRPAPLPAETAPPPPPREENSSLINEMGKLFEKSLSILPTLKSPQETIEDLNSRAKDATKDAGDNLSRLTKPSSMVAGRMACPVSANGAPDCKTGADKLCQTKGYKEGKSLNTDSAETCSPKVLIPGRARKPDDCRTDNYVTSALCQ